MMNEIYLKNSMIIAWILLIMPIIGGFFSEMVYWYFNNPDMLKINRYGFVSAPSFMIHWNNGVCQFGKITSLLLSGALLVIAVYLTIQYDRIKNRDLKDTETLKKYAKIIFIIMLVISVIYFVLQIIMNSLISHTLGKKELYGLGLFEYFIPFYILVTVMLVYLYHIAYDKEIKYEYLTFLSPVLTFIIFYAIFIYGHKIFVQYRTKQAIEIIRIKKKRTPKMSGIVADYYPTIPTLKPKKNK